MGGNERLAALRDLEKGIGHLHNYVKQLIIRMQAELSVLGFLAASLFFAYKLGAAHATAERTVEERWFPQRDVELTEVVEYSHMALFVGMCLYFSVMLIAARCAM